MTPAETLRAAAKLMRERAEAVPQNWCLVRSQIIAVGTGRLAGTDVIGDCQVPARAAYVASMHPGVALAVADWLELAAGLDDATVFPAGDEVFTRRALAVARAYLGEAA